MDLNGARPMNTQEDSDRRSGYFAAQAHQSPEPDYRLGATPIRGVHPGVFEPAAARYPPPEGFAYGSSERCRSESSRLPNLASLNYPSMDSSKQFSNTLSESGARHDALQQPNSSLERAPANNTPIVSTNERGNPYKLEAQVQYKRRADGVVLGFRIETRVKATIKLVDASSPFGFPVVVERYKDIHIVPGGDYENGRPIDQSSLGLFATVLREDGSEVKTCLECVNREQKHFKRPNCDWPLDFGSQKVIRFSTGEAKIGFRIICYCKHHGQKIGFRVHFILRDWENNVVAEGTTDPIMVKDDHKKGKKRSKKACVELGGASISPQKEHHLVDRANAPTEGIEGRFQYHGSDGQSYSHSSEYPLSISEATIYSQPGVNDRSATLLSPSVAGLSPTQYRRALPSDHYAHSQPDYPYLPPDGNVYNVENRSYSTLDSQSSISNFIPASTSQVGQYPMPSAGGPSGNISDFNNVHKVPGSSQSMSSEAKPYHHPPRRNVQTVRSRVHDIKKLTDGTSK